MERLTGKRDRRTYIVGCPDFALPKIVGLIIQQTVDRLAAIEDILGDEYDLNLVQRLIQAYKEGRYIIMKEPEQAGVSRLRELAQADKLIGKEVWAQAKYLNVFQTKSSFIQRTTIQYVSLLKGKDILCHTQTCAFPLNEIGKTVFSTRAEAEDALRREQE